MGKINSRKLARFYGSWLAFVAAPLIINGLVWKSYVVPQQATLHAWRDAQAVAESRPKLKTLLSESYQLRLNWGKASFTKDYPSVMQVIQRSAGTHSVQVKETRMKGQQSQGDTEKQTIPLELEVTGSFSKLARWMSDIESQYGFRVDSWTLEKSSEASPQLSVRMTVFTGGA